MGVEDLSERRKELVRLSADVVEVVVEACLEYKYIRGGSERGLLPARPMMSSVILLNQLMTSMRAGSPAFAISALQTLRN